MRIWLDPDKLFQYSLTVGDVTSAVAAQNIQVSTGELGGLPAHKGQRLNATIIGPSRMESVGEVVKTLLEAIVLVFLVMFVFLQNFRATLIPTIAVPVVLYGGRRPSSGGGASQRSGRCAAVPAAHRP